MSIKDFLFSKKYNSLYYRISYFFKYKIPFVSPSWYEYNFPLYEWIKCRKLFKRPKAHLIYSNKGDLWFFGLPVNDNRYNPILDIRFSSLGWKWKYDEVRHEWDPYISIKLFKRWHWVWVFNWVSSDDKYSNTRSMATWEAILDYLYNNKTIEQVIDDHIWLSGFKENSHKITINSNLK